MHRPVDGVQAMHGACVPQAAMSCRWLRRGGSGVVSGWRNDGQPSVLSPRDPGTTDATAVLVHGIHTRQL